MTSLKNGTWTFTHFWQGAPAYSFQAILNNGTITIENGKYFGTYTTLDGSDQVAIAIADFKSKTITSYVGNYLGNIMGGQMTGAPDKGSATPKGIWEAAHSSFFETPQGTFGIGE